MLQQLQLFEAIIEREVNGKQRRITKSEFMRAPIVETLQQMNNNNNPQVRIIDMITPLQCDILWDVINTSSDGFVGPSDLVTNYPFRGTMKDINPGQMKDILNPEAQKRRQEMAMQNNDKGNNNAANGEEKESKSFADGVMNFAEHFSLAQLLVVLAQPLSTLLIYLKLECRTSVLWKGLSRYIKILSIVRLKF